MRNIQAFSRISNGVQTKQLLLSFSKGWTRLASLPLLLLGVLSLTWACSPALSAESDTSAITVTLKTILALLLPISAIYLQRRLLEYGRCLVRQKLNIIGVVLYAIILLTIWGLVFFYYGIVLALLLDPASFKELLLKACYPGILFSHNITH